MELSFCGQPLVFTDEIGATVRLAWGSEPDQLRSITDANGATYAFGYDRDQRLVSRRTFDGRLMLTRWEGSRVVATVDPAGRETAYAYDRHGRIKATQSPDGETTYAYDAFGRVETVGSAEGSTTYARDAQGHIVAEEQEGHRIEWSLDALGVPLGQRSSLGAEASHRFSPAGRCLEVVQGDARIAFERDALGRETSRTMGASARLDQAYDPVGRLLSQHVRGGTQTDFGRTFEYDAAGFLRGIFDSVHGDTLLHHNARGDLTGVVRSQGTSDAHIYDGARNRVYSAWTVHGAALAEALSRAEEAKRDGTVHGEPIDLFIAQTPHDEANFAYAKGNRLVHVDRSDGSTLLYEYDACGQVVAKTLRRGDQNIATWGYAWNARGELVRFTTPNGKEWHYRYDTIGRRVEKRSPTGDVWRYVWAGAVLLHTLKNGVLVETYVHEPGGRCPLARIADELRYIVPDSVGAPSEELTPDGRLTWIAQKGTWGEGFVRTGPTGGEPFLGQWADSESGLFYNFFRYYDPDLGRYLSPDPIDLLGGLNLYVGVTDPFQEVDRWGLCPTKVPQPGQPPDPAEANGWKLDPKKDADWRGTGKTSDEAVQLAFAKTGVPMEKFTVSQWGKNEWGKTVPVEWQGPNGAQVNLDVGHSKKGPGVPHVGYETEKKDYPYNRQRGHILLDKVPANRPPS